MVQLVTITFEIDLDGKRRKIYNEDHARVFDVVEDANAYRDYLVESGKVDLGWQPTIIPLNSYPNGYLNLDDLRRADALNKLTPTELS